MSVMHKQDYELIADVLAEQLRVLEQQGDTAGAATVEQTAVRLAQALSAADSLFLPATFLALVRDRDKPGFSPRQARAVNSLSPRDRAVVAATLRDLKSGQARQARQARGISQADIADSAGVTPQAVSAWESGKSIPEPGCALAYARRLGGGSQPARKDMPGPKAIPDAHDTARAAEAAWLLGLQHGHARETPFGMYAAGGSLRRPGDDSRQLPDYIWSVTMPGPESAALAAAIGVQPGGDDNAVWAAGRAYADAYRESAGLEPSAPVAGVYLEGQQVTTGSGAPWVLTGEASVTGQPAARSGSAPPTVIHRLAITSPVVHVYGSAREAGQYAWTRSRFVPDGDVLFVPSLQVAEIKHRDSSYPAVALPKVHARRYAESIHLAAALAAPDAPRLASLAFQQPGEAAAAGFPAGTAASPRSGAVSPPSPRSACQPARRPGRRR